jgi:hypothetical protein
MGVFVGVVVGKNDVFVGVIDWVGGGVLVGNVQLQL